MEKNGKRYKVLIVDDQEPMRMLLAQYIGEGLPGAEIALAGTCEGALQLADRTTYDVILLDLLMPGIGGFEVLKRIRISFANKTTPVVVVSILTASIMGEAPVSFDRAKALGANAGVAKPVRRGALIAAVKAQLRTKV